MTENIPANLQNKVASVFFYEKDYDWNCIVHLTTINLKKPYVEVSKIENMPTHYSTRMTIVPESEWEYRADEAVKLSLIGYWYHITFKPELNKRISNLKYRIAQYQRNRRLRNVTLDDAYMLIRADCTSHKSCYDCPNKYMCGKQSEKWVNQSGKYEEIEEEEEDDY